MKSKSLLNFKPGAESFFDICARRGLKYGSILAESYWKRCKDGSISESEPVTSEILTALFWPFTPSTAPGADKNSAQIKIGHIFTGCTIEHITGAGGVHIEKITFKPTPAVMEQRPERVESELINNFKQHHTAND